VMNEHPVSSAPAPGARPSRCHVLVVDDDRDIRETIQEILEYEGYEVATARNGLEALAVARDARPMVILLDLFMPVVDGTEFRRRQQEDQALAGIPVVVISAAAGLEERIASLGVAAHLEKPLDIEALFATVAHHCR
jgi:CheY-like chemotaxis protein